MLENPSWEHILELYIHLHFAAVYKVERPFNPDWSRGTCGLLSLKYIQNSVALGFVTVWTQSYKTWLLNDVWCIGFISHSANVQTLNQQVAVVRLDWTTLKTSESLSGCEQSIKLIYSP